ncbi:class I SAM-dependent methyltransferase [Natronolimnobius baerhuensis]|uniref:SAM-dependent methyltransferase n=1 Tax=Natronolimnobius baerhuensis TaxID=253108 RepID=A0A202EDC2_9EURY|nr:class I SAM-dependent methyltransferase [Natronolimnobius baerhuensis]OVE86188.1 SAM-dependent methyltransferase [Natronolimnobius baerhuensis]
MNSNDVRRQWADRSGEYSPEYYAYYGPDDTSDGICRTLEQFVDRTAPVLELGCSSGRHLAHLYEHGFENVTGIELNGDALEVMEEAYPDLAADGEFHIDAIEGVVSDFADDEFSVVYSVETLQHLHPDATWVFDELSRITSDVLITAEIEHDDLEQTAETAPSVQYIDDEFPLYHRDWNEIFTSRGFDEVDVSSGERETIRTFRPPSSDAQ